MRTAHRLAAHAKRAIKIEDEDLPKWWRKKITPGQMEDCTWVVKNLIRKFTNGTATGQDMWDWIESSLTYSELMRLLQLESILFTDEAVAAIAENLEHTPAIVERFRRTGRVGFNGEQLLAARAAAEVMDQLIELDRFGFAVRAAQWSVEQTDRMRGKQ